MRGHVRQPARVIVGHCSACWRVLVVENEYEVWPYVVCECGWHGGTDEIANRIRYERDGLTIGGPT